VQARDAKLLAETFAIFQQERSPHSRKREREVAIGDGGEEEREGRRWRGRARMGPPKSEFVEEKRCKGACDVSALLN